MKNQFFNHGWRSAAGWMDTDRNVNPSCGSEGRTTKNMGPLRAPAGAPDYALRINPVKLYFNIRSNIKHKMKRYGQCPD